MKRITITIEGEPKTGKSTIARCIAYNLISDGIQVDGIRDGAMHLTEYGLHQLIEDEDPQEMEQKLGHIGALARVEIVVKETGI